MKLMHGERLRQMSGQVNIIEKDIIGRGPARREDILRHHAT